MSRRSGYVGRGVGSQGSRAQSLGGSDPRARRAGQGMSTDEAAGRGLSVEDGRLVIDVAKAQKLLIRFENGSALTLDRGTVHLKSGAGLTQDGGVLALDALDSVRDVSSGASTTTLAAKMNELLAALRLKGFMVS